jgi:hypothetical protein
MLALYCSAMLFDDERLHFFRPLTGKYREQIAACLGELYARLYSSLADYSRVIGRDLDFGMQILKSLRSRFEDLEACPVGYESLRIQLQVGGGHGTRADDSKAQVDPVLTGCPYADSVLLPAIRRRGRMDQESRR